MCSLFRDDIMSHVIVIENEDKTNPIAYEIWQNEEGDNLDRIIDEMLRDFCYPSYDVLDGKDGFFKLRKSTNPFGCYWPQVILGSLGFDLSE